MRRIAPLLILALAFAAACNGGDDATPTPTATATSEPTATSTASPTAEPTSVPTDTPSPTATPDAGPSSGDRYGVVKVHRNDPDGGLNLRAEPDLGSEIVGVIPPNAADVAATGDRVQSDDLVLYQVTHDGITGWVNAAFLTPLPNFDRLTCGDTATDYTYGGDVPAPTEPVDDEADHVFSMHAYDGLECERLVVTFGRDFSFDADFDLLLEQAEGVPADIALALDLASLRVALPEAVIAAQSTASETFRRDNGLADVFFVRPEDATGFGILALWDRNRGARVSYLEHPGRMVIDTVDAPSGTGLALGPVLPDDPSALTFLTRAINVDVNGPAPEPPIEVTGYGRPFEATTVIRLRTEPAAGEPPGSGDPVNADWSGSSFADSCGSTYVVMTTDYLEAWGEFSFAIEALAPGTYELFVGEDSPADGTEQGVYHVFTVGGSTAASC